MALLSSSLRPKRVVDLSGPDGNAFNLLGIARAFTTELDYSKADRAQLMLDLMSGNYKNLVERFDKEFGDYVDLILPDNWDKQ